VNEQQVEEWANKIIGILQKENVRASEAIDIFQTLLANIICSSKTKGMAVRVLTDFSQEVLNMIAEEYKDEAKGLK
jgi:hypothetical protein